MNSSSEVEFRLFDYERFSWKSFCENVNRLFVTRLAIIILLSGEVESRTAHSGTALYRGPVAKRELCLCIRSLLVFFVCLFVCFVLASSRDVVGKLL